MQFIIAAGALVVAHRQRLMVYGSWLTVYHSGNDDSETGTPKSHSSKNNDSEYVEQAHRSIPISF